MYITAQPRRTRQPSKYHGFRRLLAACLSPACVISRVGTLAVAITGLAPVIALGAERDAASPRFVLEWGRRGSEPGQFDFPIGITINRADEVFVTDFTNARVQKFSSDGTFLAAFPVSPFPGGIALDGDENI